MPTLEADEPWIAPSEVAESGFMDEPSDTQPPSPDGEGAPSPTKSAAHGLEMNVGTWVNLLVDDKWERTQLSWIGSHGNLFLFTNAYGHTQSMTRRLLDKLLARGSLRVISGQTVVAGALDSSTSRPAQQPGHRRVADFSRTVHVHHHRRLAQLLLSA